MNAPPPHQLLKALLRTNWACEPRGRQRCARSTLPHAAAEEGGTSTPLATTPVG